MVSFFILCPIINLIHTSFAPALSISEAKEEEVKYCEQLFLKYIGNPVTVRLSDNNEDPIIEAIN